MSIADGGIRDVTLQSERLGWAEHEQDTKTQLEHEHLEKTKSLGNEGEGDQPPPPESPFKHMPRRKAARVFWKVVICCVMVAWTAIMDGFLITSEWHRAPGEVRDCAGTKAFVAYNPRTVPGSIVANTYFIQQFATVCSKGSCALDARYVGAFTGVQSVGQIIGMLVSPPQYIQYSHSRFALRRL
jgi:hypothetical protein